MPSKFDSIDTQFNPSNNQNKPAKFLKKILNLYERKFLSKYNHIRGTTRAKLMLEAMVDLFSPTLQEVNRVEAKCIDDLEWEWDYLTFR